MQIHSKQKLALVYVLMLGILIPSVSFAQINKGLRENFSQIITELCHSSVSYDVDDRVGINTETGACESSKCQEYHTKLNCLFGGAFAKTISDTQTDVSDVVDESLSDVFRDEVVPAPANCPNNSIENIQGDQVRHGFVSTCEDENVNYSYSPCRVAETALLEFCGYQKFLLAKAIDRVSYKAENPTYNGVDVPQIAQQTYIAELKKSESALSQLLELYRTIEQQYRFESWLQGFLAEIRPLQQKLVRFLQNAALFPDKFVNPSSN